MDEKEFFYIDRPSVPAVKQNLIDPVALLQHAVVVDPDSINPDAVLFASEVKDADGTIVGTVLYAPHMTYEYVTGVSSDVLTDEGEVKEEALSDNDGVDDLPIPDVADLELELAEARQVVQDIEDEIAALRQDESGC